MGSRWGSGVGYQHGACLPVCTEHRQPFASATEDVFSWLFIYLLMKFALKFARASFVDKEMAVRRGTSPIHLLGTRR